MNAIDTKTLTKRFKSRTAVDSLDLQVADGEFFALLGQNGAGKTTTIRMLSCLSVPTSGDAFVCGHSIIKEPDEVKKLINVSPQETAIAPNLTVFENLVFIAEIYGASHDKAVAAAESSLADFSLGERKNDRAKTLSGGWQRRLSVAMALISKPRLLFLDEPTLGLDVRARRSLWEHISALKGKVTVVLTTHYLEEAENLADRIAIMEKGKIAALGTAQELMTEYGKKSLEDVFLALTEGDGDEA